MAKTSAIVALVGLVLWTCGQAAPVIGQEASLKQLQEENARLQQELKAQKETIDQLRIQLEGLSATTRATDDRLRDLQEQLKTGNTADSALSEPKKKTEFSIGNVALTGEGGVGFFHSGSDGAHSHSNFRVDEAKLFVEAPLWESVYFYSELDVVTREANDEFFHLGELYLDFERVLRHWDHDSALNIRAGRFYIPFGEEYQSRYVIDNPLVSHSLSDLWGVDEGIEAYGSIGRFQYAVAVQNGGDPTLNDYDSDKSVAGRIGVDPLSWLHLSVSGMRTGNLDVKGDRMSAQWFGGGFFRAISPKATKFDANLVEGDVQARWKSGWLKGAGGYAETDGNDPSFDDRRNIYYYYAEGVQDLPAKFYSAARFSQIFADKGFPIVGNGDFGDYFYGPLTSDIWRLSLGLGYRFSENLIVKAEYSFEQGSMDHGLKRQHEDLLGIEVGMKF